ncbi:AraC family transcriptional regulator [Elizabethkingia anophelis]|uniref:helix-turn-helix domain-containing protein n=1 Tax=Elizabethkingia anophelis TaxID=1117645 RepID=UPI000CE997FE|nr:AraC family transcriptional regulator [Elizabethkingia anophelis]AVF46955.1 AraC family transcriptional regulator [Elizabethkingia anophelis]AVF50945.1 AraC family transcriptional regulator [Elizabethkingia anophelis]MBG0504451.1 helix-turn-helix transcriptional regulator [Elizabethkingia anophelis]MCT4072385.1 helix-turn-helix transcriptional regulator [Elizabethkingia anophelis]MDV3901533.1 AraC family transcriptional regulator [Elizabethkingia anophelis]
MNIITLPDELNIDISSPVQVFDYTSSQEVSRQQIILNQNAFSFLIDGSKEVVFDNSSLSIDNSKFILMRSGHCLMTERLSDLKNYRSILFFFSDIALSKFIRSIELNKAEPSKHSSVHAFEYNEFITRFISSLSDISKLSDKVRSKLLEFKFHEIMLYLTELHGTDFIQSLIVNSNDATRKFIHIIESNQLNKLSLKELAFLCNMSVSTFKREFEKHYTESPVKWFQNKRLEYARHLLNNTKKSPSEIYFEVGYENLSSFIQAYKLKYGTTPKHHQKI